MGLQNLILFTNRLEDPKHPLMGPIIKALYFFGLWEGENKIRNFLYNLVHFSTLLFVITIFVDLYHVKDDLNLVINNMSLSVLSSMCVLKCMMYISHRKDWKELNMNISKLELKQLKEDNELVKEQIKEYTKYSRSITFLYWGVVFLTNTFLIVSPFLKYLSKNYREAVSKGEEEMPHILCSWFPFNHNKMPGYLVAIFVHIFMSCQGAGVLGSYDMNTVAIMSYLKGQMIILRSKCTRIFDNNVTEKIILSRIKECHKHHNELVKHYKMLNSLLSPTMFLYVLFCSITICGAVVQFTSKEATASQKLWIIQYSTALVIQLFLYCWHSNEVAIETKAVDRGVYESKWYKGNALVRKQILLLAAKLDNTLIFKAGPYTNLSVATFIDILKGSYSFYTLFSQMHDDN